MESKLTEGRIPAHKPCPFRERCELFHACECRHKGELHTVPFSCGAARAFDIMERKVLNACGEPGLTEPGKD